MKYKLRIAGRMNQSMRKSELVMYSIFYLICDNQYCGINIQKLVIHVLLKISITLFNFFKLCGSNQISKAKIALNVFLCLSQGQRHFVFRLSVTQQC